jgi:hypothetical protein
MNLGKAGAITFALGLFLLGAISLASGQFIPGIQPILESLSGSSAVARLNGILLVALSVGLFSNRFQKPAAMLLASYLAAWLLAAHLPQLLVKAFDITRLVGLMEVAAIVAALGILAFNRDRRPAAPARFASIVYGCMLLLFAAVHFTYREFIASMIPGWIPFAALWPWVTASVNLAAGLTFLTGIKSQIGGALIGAMYASWVPIVHLPRIFAAPDNVDEWTAGAVAVTLAGAAWLVAGSVQGRGNDPVASLAGTVRRFVQKMSEREAAG